MKIVPLTPLSYPNIFLKTCETSKGSNSCRLMKLIRVGAVVNQFWCL